MTWNTLDVPLETGWQCTLIPGPQYSDLTRWGRGYRNLSARQLYLNAGRDNSAYSWNTRPQSEADDGDAWEKDRLRQLADDKAAFARHFRPNGDLRTIIGEKALRDVQAFVRDRLNVAHWKLPTDNAALRKLLLDAVASGQLVPVVNREYRGVPRIAPPTHVSQRWPATGGGSDAYPPKVYSAREFDALRRANGELPPLNSGAGVVSATLNPQPALGIPATSDDGSGLLDLAESVAGALLGGGDGGSENGDDADFGAFDEDAFSNVSGTSTPLGDAQPFDYLPDMSDADGEELAARTNNPRFAARMLGYDQNTFSEMLHVLKPANGLGPADNVIFHDDGSIEFNGQMLDDNIHNYAP